jgi:predicted nucleotidyltransferase
MSHYSWSDCPADVRTQVTALCAAFRQLLGTELTGIYLHGSLVMGCFNPHSSDLDLLVMVESKLDHSSKRQLAMMLLEVSLTPCPVEVSILTQDTLQHWHHPCRYTLHYSEMWRDAFLEALTADDHPHWQPEQGDPDLAAHITVLNHRGLCLVGRSINQVFPTIPEADYLDAILGDVFDAFKAPVSNPAYAVLNACRTCAFIRSGLVCSKREGGLWALQVLPERYHTLIQTALQIYEGTSEETIFGALELSDFIEFIRSYLKQASIGTSKTD